MGRTLLHLRQKNVVGILGFKPYFGFWFHQGVLLEHRKKVLIDAQQGKTKALRQWRMNSPNDIKPATIKAYVREAITGQGRSKKPVRNIGVRINRV